MHYLSLVLQIAKQDSSIWSIVYAVHQAVRVTHRSERRVNLTVTAYQLRSTRSIPSHCVALVESHSGHCFAWVEIHRYSLYVTFEEEAILSVRIASVILSDLDSDIGCSRVIPKKWPASAFFHENEVFQSWCFSCHFFLLYCWIKVKISDGS